MAYLRPLDRGPTERTLMNAKNGMRPVNPGEIRREELDELGMQQVESPSAEKTHLTHSHVLATFEGSGR